MRALEIALLILWIINSRGGRCGAVVLCTQLSSNTNRWCGEASQLTCVYGRDALLSLRPEPTTNASYVYPPVLQCNIPEELIRKRRRKRRGRKGVIRNRLRRRFTRIPPLPSIVLAKVRALHNKIATVRTYAKYSHDFREASLFCFTESSTKFKSIPDSLSEDPGFTLV